MAQLKYVFLLSGRVGSSFAERLLDVLTLSMVYKREMNGKIIIF